MPKKGAGSGSDDDGGGGGDDDSGADVLLPLCKFGAACPSRDPKHEESHRHPCTFGDGCTRKNPHHFRMSTHPTLTWKMAVAAAGGGGGGGAKKAKAKPAAAAPTVAAAVATASTSGVACKYGSACYNLAPDHRKKFSHPVVPLAGGGGAGGGGGGAKRKAGGGGGDDKFDTRSAAVKAHSAAAAVLGLDGAVGGGGSDDDDLAGSSVDSSMSGEFKRSVVKMKPTEKMRRAKREADAALAAASAHPPAAAAAAAAAAGGGEDDENGSGGSDGDDDGDGGRAKKRAKADAVAAVSGAGAAGAAGVTLPPEAIAVVPVVPDPASVNAWRSFFSSASAGATDSKSKASATAAGAGSGGKPEVFSMLNVGYEGASFSSLSHVFFHVTDRTQCGELCAPPVNYTALWEAFIRPAVGDLCTEIGSKVKADAGVEEVDDDSSPDTPIALVLRSLPGAVLTKLVSEYADEDAEGNYTTLQRVQPSEFVDVKQWIARGERRLKVQDALLRYAGASHAKYRVLATPALRVHVLSFVDTRYSFVPRVLLAPSATGVRCWRLCASMGPGNAWNRYLFGASIDDVCASICQRYDVFQPVWRLLSTGIGEARCQEDGGIAGMLKRIHAAFHAETLTAPSPAASTRASELLFSDEPAAVAVHMSKIWNKDSVVSVADVRHALTNQFYVKGDFVSVSLEPFTCVTFVHPTVTAALGASAGAKKAAK